MASLTLLDVAKKNGSNAAIGLIEENLNAAPEMSIIPARTVSGTSFKSLIRTGFPKVPFRKAGAGSTPVVSTYTNRLHSMFYLDGQMEIDTAIASADEEGEDNALTMEASGVMQGALLSLGSQLWYGQSSDANGFQGAADFVDAAHTVDATGTTSNGGSSVYLIVADPKFMSLVFGNNTPMTLGTWRKNTLSEGTAPNTTRRTVWNNSLECWVGAAFLNIHAVVRIKNLTDQANKTLTDALLAKACAKFPTNVRPTHIVMNRNQKQYLQISRTVVLNGSGSTKPGGGLANIAPPPTEYDGIPIITTDSITQTEAIV
jgi:hypothetical protein